MRTAKADGTAPTDFALGQGRAFGIAVSNRYVYWSVGIWCERRCDSPTLQVEWLRCRGGCDRAVRTLWPCRRRLHGRNVLGFAGFRTTGEEHRHTVDCCGACQRPECFDGCRAYQQRGVLDELGHGAGRIDPKNERRWGSSVVDVTPSTIATMLVLRDNVLCGIEGAAGATTGRVLRMPCRAGFPRYAPGFPARHRCGRPECGPSLTERTFGGWRDEGVVALLATFRAMKL